MAIEVTEEMRAAVYAADCERLGHMINVQSAFSGVPVTGETASATDLLGPDADKLPYISCFRCGNVWVVIPESAGSYDATTAKIKADLKNPDSLKPKVRSAPKPAPLAKATKP